MNKKFSIPVAVLVTVLGVSIVGGCINKKSEKSKQTKPEHTATASSTSPKSNDPVEGIYGRVRDSPYAHEKLNILEREILPQIGPNPDPDVASRAFRPEPRITGISSPGKLYFFKSSRTSVSTRSISSGSSTMSHLFKKTTTLGTPTW